MFKVHVHEVPESFFYGVRPGEQKDGQRTERRRPTPPDSGRSSAAQVRQWQERAEQLAKRYASLLEAYKQTKAKAEGAKVWRQHCQKMLNELLRVTQACDLTGAVDRTGDPDATLDAVLAGIRQLRDQVLASLCEIGLLQPIEPKPGETFDRVRCLAVGTAPEGPADAVVDELIECGYACNEQIVRQAKVSLAPKDPDAQDEG